MCASVSLGLGRGAQKNGPDASSRRELGTSSPRLSPGQGSWPHLIRLSLAAVMLTGRLCRWPGQYSGLGSSPHPPHYRWPAPWIPRGRAVLGPRELIHTAFVLQAVKTEQREFVGSWVGWTGSWLRGPSPMGLSLSHICSWGPGCSLRTELPQGLACGCSLVTAEESPPLQTSRTFPRRPRSGADWPGMDSRRQGATLEGRGGEGRGRLVRRPQPQWILFH